MKPPACYGPWPPARSIAFTAITGWHAAGRLPEYKGPPWPGPAPEKAESACDLIVWYAAYPEATCSFRTALALARLHAEYGRPGRGADA